MYSINILLTSCSAHEFCMTQFALSNLLYHTFALCVYSFRISLSDTSNSPFLYYGSGTEFKEIKWGSPDFLSLLHSSCVMEISTRGIRTVSHFKNSQFSYCVDTMNYVQNRISSVDAIHQYLNQNCLPEEEALCWINSHGGLFPTSAKLNQSVAVSGRQQPFFNSSILSFFHRKSKLHCGNANNGISNQGRGRTFIQLSVSDMDVYSISSCDIMNSNIHVVYTPFNNKIQLIMDTYGPMAYCILLTVTVLLLYMISFNFQYMTDPNVKSMFNLHVVISSMICICTSLSLLLSYFIFSFVFLNIEDEIYFILSIILTLSSSCIGLYVKTNEINFQSCIWTLSSIACIVYRSPENPYIFLIAFVFAIEMWYTLYNIINIASKQQPTHQDTMEWIYQLAKLSMTMVYIFLCLELGIKHLYKEPEDWIIYAGMGFLVTYSIHLCVALNKSISYK